MQPFFCRKIEVRSRKSRPNSRQRRLGCVGCPESTPKLTISSNCESGGTQQVPGSPSVPASIAAQEASTLHTLTIHSHHFARKKRKTKKTRTVPDHPPFHPCSSTKEKRDAALDRTAECAHTHTHTHRERERESVHPPEMGGRDSGSTLLPRVPHSESNGGKTNGIEQIRTCGKRSA